jgi:hypothetical protein
MLLHLLTAGFGTTRTSRSLLRMSVHWVKRTRQLRARNDANDPGCVKTLEAFVGAQQKNHTCGLSESFLRGRHPVRIYLLPERPAKRFSRSQDPFLPFDDQFCCDAQRGIPLTM